MPRLSLSAADSDRFREHLSELRQKNSWSLTDVSRVLRCSRKTAWTHLQPGCQSRVRASYADRLAAFSDQDPPWSDTSKLRTGIGAIIDAWGAANDPATRRKVSWRLAIFMSEYAVLRYEMVVAVTHGVSATKNPYSVELALQNPGSREVGHITLQFDPLDRGGIEMHFAGDKERSSFRGFLSHNAFRNILNKIRSWHSKKNRHAPAP